MREIKFRGKRLDNGEWIKGNSIVRVGDGFFICDWTGVAIKKSEFYNLFTEVAPATVGQYTGLKDKNGKEIWEGDIMTIRNDDEDYPLPETPFVIVFSEGAFCIAEDQESPWGPINTPLLQKVIGNIHDNPELLK